VASHRAHPSNQRRACEINIGAARPRVRYRRRWIIERTNAWLFNFRRLVVRYERRIETYRAFLYLACSLIALRQF
jgi:transposase